MKIGKLSLVNRGLDLGGNHHARFEEKIQRKTEKGKIGEEIAWLKRLKLFRGRFWSTLTLKSDAELSEEAKRLFHNGKYGKFLLLQHFCLASTRKTEFFSEYLQLQSNVYINLRKPNQALNPTARYAYGGLAWLLAHQWLSAESCYN
jgi:hypothetical protein